MLFNYVAFNMLCVYFAKHFQKLLISLTNFKSIQTDSLTKKYKHYVLVVKTILILLCFEFYIGHVTSMSCNTVMMRLLHS